MLSYSRVLDFGHLFFLQADLLPDSKKHHGLIGKAFTWDFLEHLFEQASDASYINLQKVQLFLEVSIIMGMFLVFHVSLSKFSVVDSADLDFTGTYIST